MKGTQKLSQSSLEPVPDENQNKKNNQVDDEVLEKNLDVWRKYK